MRREQLQISVVHWPEKCLDLNKAVQGFTDYASFVQNVLKFEDSAPGAPVRILPPPQQPEAETRAEDELASNNNTSAIVNVSVTVNQPDTTVDAIQCSRLTHTGTTGDKDKDSEYYNKDAGHSGRENAADIACQRTASDPDAAVCKGERAKKKKKVKKGDGKHRADEASWSQYCYHCKLIGRVWTEQDELKCYDRNYSKASKYPNCFAMNVGTIFFFIACAFMCFLGFALAMFSFFRHRREAIRRELEAHLEAGEQLQAQTWYQEQAQQSLRSPTTAG